MHADHSAPPRPAGRAAAPPETAGAISGWMSEARATLTLAWPLVLANLAAVAIHTTDVVMVAGLGAVPLAAAGIGVTLYFQVFMFCEGIAVAVAPMLAHALGANRHSVRDVRRTLRQGAWAVIAIGAIGTVIVMSARPILSGLGLDATLVDPAAHYAAISAIGLVPSLLFMLLRTFIAALERPRAATVITVLAIGSNALCNWVLIHGKLGVPALGLTGAAITSAITNILMATALLGWMLTDRRLRRYRLLGRFWRPDGSRFREVLALGLPISVTLSFEVSLFGTATILMGLIGATESAAYQVALNVSTVTFMVAMGVAQAGTVRVGLAAGAGDAAAARRAGWVALAIGIAWMAAMAAIMVSFPRSIVGLYDPEPDMLAFAVAYLGIAALFQVFDGMQAVAAGILRGYKDTRVPMLLAGFGYWPVGMGAAVLLAFGLDWGGLGLWYGLLAGLAATGAMLMGRFLWISRRPLAPPPGRMPPPGLPPRSQAGGVAVGTDR